MTTSKRSTVKSADTTTSGLSALQSLKQKRRNSGIGWDDCDANKLQEMIQSVTSTGSLLSFSVTSDGGAIALFIKDDNDSERFYASNGEELDELLEHVHGAYHH